MATNGTKTNAAMRRYVQKTVRKNVPSAICGASAAKIADGTSAYMRAALADDKNFEKVFEAFGAVFAPRFLEKRFRPIKSGV